MRRVAVYCHTRHNPHILRPWYLSHILCRVAFSLYTPDSPHILRLWYLSHILRRVAFSLYTPDSPHILRPWYLSHIFRRVAFSLHTRHSPHRCHLRLRSHNMPWAEVRNMDRINWFFSNRNSMVVLCRSDHWFSRKISDANLRVRRWPRYFFPNTILHFYQIRPQHNHHLGRYIFSNTLPD